MKIYLEAFFLRGIRLKKYSFLKFVLLFLIPLVNEDRENTKKRVVLRNTIPIKLTAKPNYSCPKL